MNRELFKETKQALDNIESLLKKMIEKLDMEQTKGEESVGVKYRVMPDYCSSGIWHEEGYNCEPEFLTKDQLARVEEWNDLWDDMVTREEEMAPATHPKETWDDFWKQGEELARELNEHCKNLGLKHFFWCWSDQEQKAIWRAEMEGRYPSRKINYT